jgi:aromatase
VHTYNRIVIEKDIATVFDLTNDIERWPEYFDDYLVARILSCTENKITFELTNNENQTWQSVRFLDRDHWLATATRGEPRLPFRYMHLRWVYRPVPQGTEMTWEQFFEMYPASGITDTQAVERITERSQLNLERIKGLIEAGESER